MLHHHPSLMLSPPGGDLSSGMSPVPGASGAAGAGSGGGSGGSMGVGMGLNSRASSIFPAFASSSSAASERASALSGNFVRFPSQSSGGSPSALFGTLFHHFQGSLSPSTPMGISFSNVSPTSFAPSTGTCFPFFSDAMGGEGE